MRNVSRPGKSYVWSERIGIGSTARTSSGEPPNAHDLDQLGKARRALDELDKQGKPDDGAKRLAEATALFLKIDEEVRECELRRKDLAALIERETSQNMLRFSLLTDERDQLLGKQKEARAKANELSCFRVVYSPTDYAQLVKNPS